MRRVVLATLLWFLWTAYGEVPQVGPMRLLDWRHQDAFPSRKACEEYLVQHGFRRDEPEGWMKITRYDTRGYDIRKSPALPLYDFVRARCLPETLRP
jgi:hypothetical protein